MAQHTVGFIGFGNMAQAMAKGFLQAGVLEGAQIAACAKRWEKLEKTAGELGVIPCKDAAEVLERSDILILAVKPYLIETVLAPIREKLAGKVLCKALCALFLPIPLRTARVCLQSVPFLRRGMGCLLRRQLRVDLLDGISIAVSLARRDFGTAGSVAFLLELTTQILSGTHDIDRLAGPVELFLGTEKEPFPGLRGEEVHTYPGDFCV